MSAAASGCSAGNRPQAPNSPLNYTYDVCFAENGLCGSGAMRPAFLTIVHPSRIPAITNMTLYVGEEERASLERRFGFLWKDKLNVEVKDHKNTFKTSCVLRDPKAGFTSAASFGFIESIEGFGAVMVIPESVEAQRFLKIARLKGLVPVLFRQTEIEWMPIKSRLTHRDVLDGFFVDTLSRSQYYRNVIPRRHPSILDVKLNPSQYKGSPYLEYISSI